MMDMDIDDEAKEMYGDGDGDDSLPEEEVQEDEEDVAMEPRAEAADTEEDATPIASHKLEKKSNAKGEPGALNEADYEDQDDIEDDNDDEGGSSIGPVSGRAALKAAPFEELDRLEAWDIQEQARRRGNSDSYREEKNGSEKETTS